MSQAVPDRQPDRAPGTPGTPGGPGTLLRIARDAGDANLGQTILRMAGLAEAVHRFEHAAALSAQSAIQAHIHQAASEPVRTDADFGALPRLRTEVGR